MSFFEGQDWSCRCGCGKNNIHSELIFHLENARALSQVPFIINSACRCFSFNHVQKGKENSAHLTGEAIDISAKTSGEKYAIIKALLLADFNRIGIAKTFVHADISKTLPQNVIWVY